MRNIEGEPQDHEPLFRCIDSCNASRSMSEELAFICHRLLDYATQHQHKQR
jgi:hypothetical protein